MTGDCASFLPVGCIDLAVRREERQCLGVGSAPRWIHCHHKGSNRTRSSLRQLDRVKPYERVVMKL